MYMYMHDKQFLAQAVSLSYTYSLYKTIAIAICTPVGVIETL